MKFVERSGLSGGGGEGWERMGSGEVENASCNTKVVMIWVEVTEVPEQHQSDRKVVSEKITYVQS